MIDVPVEVKDALRDGRLKKNYRIVVLDDEGAEDFTIDNNNLVSESVSIDERMCSGNKIKFGLCEGSSLEFQYFGFPSILGKRLQVFIDVDYEIMRLVYETQQEVPIDDRMTITEDGNYRIYSHTPEAFLVVSIIRDGEWQGVTATSSEDGTEAILDNLLAGDLVSVGWIGSSYPSTYLQKQVLKKQIESYTIPMGFFDVLKCSRQASTGIIKVTAYNKLQSDYLDQKANDIIEGTLGNKETPLSMYSIRRELLLDYEINPYEETEQPSREVNSHLTTIKTTPKLTSLTSGGTPINAYGLFTRLGATPSTNQGLYVQIRCRAYGYNLTANSFYQVRELSNRLGETSEALAEYLKKLIDDSQLSVTGQKMVDDINIVWDAGYNALMSDGWAFLCALGIPTSKIVDGWRKYVNYSDYPYKNGVINTTFNCQIDGLVSDGEKILINTSGGGVVIYLPQMIDVFWYGSGYTYYGVRINLEEDTLYYDIDGSQQIYPRMKFKDGTNYTLEAVTNQLNVVKVEGVTEADAIAVDPSTLPDYTLRDITSAVYETNCQFGQLDRVTDLFSGVELNRSRLLPAETLYPDNALYPDGAQASATKSMYSQLWADEGNVRKWRNLLITYKGLNEQQQEKDFVYTAEINSDGTDDYDCSDNWLFRNLVWTQAQIEEYATAMVAKMQDMTWFPFEMWCPGLPYLETGDEIEIPLGQNSYTSYVLQRQLKGIQNLQDTYINGTLDIF